MLTSKQVPTITPVVKLVINGREHTATAIAKMSKAERALLAADMVQQGWTLKQALLMTGASMTYTYCALKLSAEDRRLINSGAATLSDYHNGNRADVRIDKLITRYGDRVIARLDALTTPNQVAAE